MERHEQRKVLTTGQESTQRMAMNEGRMDGRDVQIQKSKKVKGMEYDRIARMSGKQTEDVFHKQS